jgi:hypothetical protein
LEAERVRVLSALRSIRFKKKVSTGKRQKTYILTSKVKLKWINDYVARETAVARKAVQDEETAIM